MARVSAVERGVAPHRSGESFLDEVRSRWSKEGWMDDMEFLNKLMNLDVVGAFADLPHKRVVVPEMVALALATAGLISACNAPAIESSGEPVKVVIPLQNLSMETAGGDPELLASLESVKMSYGDPNCNPHVIYAQTDKKSYTDFFCALPEERIVLLARREADKTVNAQGTPIAVPGQGQIMEEELYLTPKEDVQGNIYEVSLAPKVGEPIYVFNPVMGTGKWTFIDGTTFDANLGGKFPFQDQINVLLAADAQAAYAEEPTATEWGGTSADQTKVFSDLQTQEAPKPTVTLNVDTGVATVEAENSVVMEGLNCVKDVYCLGGNMVVSSEDGQDFYRRFIHAFAISEANRDYFVNLLGGEPSGDKLLEYLRENNYYLPGGFKVPSNNRPGYVKFIDHPAFKDGVKLDAFRVVVYDWDDWGKNTFGVRDYVESSLHGQTNLLTVSPSSSDVVYGLRLDKDNRLVFISGSKEKPYSAKWERYTLGGSDGNFDTERDTLKATADLETLLAIFAYYTRDGSGFVGSPGYVEPTSPNDMMVSLESLKGKSLFVAK